MNKDDRKEFTDFRLEFTEFKGDINAQIAPMKESIASLSRWGVWFFKAVGAVIIAGAISSIVSDYNSATKPHSPHHKHVSGNGTDRG